MATYPKDPYLLYYQARYLSQLALHEQALLVINSIVQYNQFEVWITLAQIHLEIKNFGDVLVCLNHAIKLCKLKGFKNLDLVYKSFEELGKIKLASTI
jgi:tetratricopeptide (TPR) repeat protein